LRLDTDDGLIDAHRLPVLDQRATGGRASSPSWAGRAAPPRLVHIGAFGLGLR
jgi:hypothetical protein